MKVFIVGDSLMVSDSIIKMLSPISKTEVCGTSNWHMNPLKQIDEINPDVVILHNDLALESALYMIENIKKSRSDTIVIMLTNLSENLHYGERCMKLGADYYFNKNDDYNNITDIFLKKFQLTNV